MRCYISKKYNPLAYKKYLEDICKCDFQLCKSEYNGFNCVKCKKFKKYILIRGENYEVTPLLCKICIIEQNIILITCTVNAIISIAKKYNPSLFPVKNIYFPKYSDDGDYLTCYDYSASTLGFNPCKAELKLGEDSDLKNIDFRDALRQHFYYKTIKELSDEQI